MNDITRQADETYEQYDNRRRAHEREQARGLFTLAHGIAKELARERGERWVVVPVDPNGPEHQERHPHLRRLSDGAEFWIGLDWRGKGRVDVVANWPRDTKGQEQRPYFSQYSEFGSASPTITFAATKSASQAAKDINRRFLSTFLPLWEKQAAVVAERHAYTNRQKDLAGRIAPLVGGTATTDRNGLDVVRIPYDRDHGVTDVEFAADEQHITVKLRCSVDELQAILREFPWLVK